MPFIILTVSFMLAYLITIANNTLRLPLALMMGNTIQCDKKEELEAQENMREFNTCIDKRPPEKGL